MTSTDQTETKTKGIEIVTILHITLISLVVLHLLYFIYILIKQNCFKNSNIPSLTKPENLKKINDSCCICLEEIKYEVQLLCSHSFCAHCIILYSKQKHNFNNVKCPICRSHSKFMFTIFDRADENKDFYDQIISYNYEITSTYSTSFCFCLDMFRFCQYYLRQIADFENRNYDRHRKVIIFILFVIFIFVIFPLNNQQNLLELVEDGSFYVFLIVSCAEYFYRRFRNQTNIEFEMISSNRNDQNNESLPHVNIEQVNEIQV